MTWRPARSLPVLHRQLRPLAPHADPASWGLKGDDRHDSTSDHAPKDFPGWGNDIVTAADFPDEEQLVAFDVLDAIRLSRDPRVKYGISEGLMFSSYPARGYDAWVWRPYTGTSDPHDTHGHLSVVGAPIADDERPWTITQQEDDMPYGMLRNPITGRVYALFGTGTVRWIGVAEFGLLTRLKVPLDSVHGLDEVARLERAAGING
jgi:hypothetical protein